MQQVHSDKGNEKPMEISLKRTGRLTYRHCICNPKLALKDIFMYVN